MKFFRKTCSLLTLAALLLVCASCGPVTAPQPPEGSAFSVRFLDVGQADAALVSCDGEYMLIDGGNADDSDLVYATLEKLGVDELDYMVATHAHEDHIGGLSGALNYAAVDTAFSPVSQYNTKVFQNMVKYLDEQNKSLTIPQPGDTFTLGSAQVEVLGPVAQYDDPNNTSIVLRVDYGETAFLFTGDMEAAAEADLLDSGAYLAADVLKVGHHGSGTSTSYRFLREVMPRYAVISVGAGNKYGHPSDDVLSRLRDADAQVFRTDMQGTIVAESDGTTVTFYTEKEASSSTNPTQPTQPGYVGNSGTMKFHRPDCSSAKNLKEENRVEFASRQEAVSGGYEACQRCKP